MAFDGTVTRTTNTFGVEQVIHYAIAGFDADAEDSSTIETIDLWTPPLSHFPRQFMWWVSRTAGATDVVSVKLWGKPDDGTVWIELGEITGAAGTNPTQSTLTVDPAIADLGVYRYLKVTVPTVGAANTLTVYIDTIPRAV